MTQTEDWKRDVCEIFFAQRKVILRTTALIFLGSVAVAFLWPPTYEATSSILLRGKKTQVSPGSLEVTEIRALPIEKEDVSSEIEILNSPRLIEMTVNSIREKGDSTLDSPPGGALGSLVERVRSKGARGGDPQVALARVVRRVRSRLRLEVVPSSNVIKVRYRGSSLQEVESVLDELLTQYMSYRSTVFNPADQQQFYAERTELYRQKLEETEDLLCGMAKESSVTMAEREMGNNIELKLDLMRRLSSLRDEYVSSSFLRNPSIEARMTLLQMTIRELETRNVDLQRHHIDRQRVQREAELLEYSYETFAKRGEEAKINADISKANLSGDVTLLSRAAYSGERVFPRKLLTVVLGLVVGFIAGCSLGFMGEYFDHTVKSPAHVARSTGLPVVCSISKS